MRYRSLAAATVMSLVGLAAAHLALAAQSQPDPAPGEPTSAKSWIGREEEFEEFLKSAEVVDLEPIGVGVTNPWRAELAPGGPIGAFAWKPIRPGRYHGHYESYKSEVAAYRLDRLLELAMVPVTVERRVNREVGAACMWVAPAQSFRELGGPPTPPSYKAAHWNRQLVRAKMFDNLIRNKDPNLGNWLVDPAWNLILIDHSRAFASGTQMVHEITRVDGDLWEKMKRLDEATLSAALEELLSRVKIREILKRRDRMAQEVEKLVAANGEAAVFLRSGEASP